MKRTFVCLFHASDCSEEVEVTIDEVEHFTHHRGADAPRVFGRTYTLVSYPASCKCGRPVPHADPPQEELRRAYHLDEAEDV